MKPGRVIAAIIAGITILAMLAPHDVSPPRPVSPASIGNGAITGNPCGTYAPMVSATLVNQTGYRLYRVVCQLGVTLMVAR